MSPWEGLVSAAFCRTYLSTLYFMPPSMHLEEVLKGLAAVPLTGGCALRGLRIGWYSVSGRAPSS
jgi:hypothetical protein